MLCYKTKNVFTSAIKKKKNYNIWRWDEREKCYGFLKENGIRVSAFWDNDRNKKGMYIKEYQLYCLKVYFLPIILFSL